MKFGEVDEVDEVVEHLRHLLATHKALRVHGIGLNGMGSLKHCPGRAPVC